MLNEIQNALLGLDPNVYYGTSAKHDRDAPWDYMVFSRGAIRPSKNKTGYVDVVHVQIVREEYVPDGLPEQVVATLKEAGVKVSDEDAMYDYVVKPKTTDTVEIVSMTFVRPRKRPPNV